MRASVHAAILFVVASALPAQAASKPLEPKAAFAELVAEGTKPARRGELFGQLCEVEFATFGKELARELGKPRNLEDGVGWSTPEPWLETRLATRTQVLGTLHRVWEQHLGYPLDDSEVQVLLQILEEPSFGVARQLAVHQLLPAHRPESFAVSVMARIDRLARVDVVPEFRATCIAGLVQAIAADGYVIPAIEVAKTAGQSGRELDLLLQTKVLDHILELAPTARVHLMQYLSGLRHRLDNPNDRGRFDYVLGHAHDLSSAEWARHAHVCFRQHTLVQGGVGNGEVRRTSSGQLDPIELVACGAFELDWRSLAPLAPVEGPVKVGARWEVRAEKPSMPSAVLGCGMGETGPVPQHLGGLVSNLMWIDWKGRNAGSEWGGAMAHRRGAKLQGALTATVERRGDAIGCAVAGELTGVVDDPSNGPNAPRVKLSSRETHRIALWLPFDDEGRFTGFELRDDIAITGSYGRDPFTAKLSFTSAPGPLLTHAELRQAAELIVAATNGNEVVGKQLLPFGIAVNPDLAAAIAQTPDFGAKRSLTDVLLQLTYYR